MRRRSFKHASQLELSCREKYTRRRSAMTQALEDTRQHYYKMILFDNEYKERINEK
jgi:hypothetical protein